MHSGLGTKRCSAHSWFGVDAHGAGTTLMGRACSCCLYWASNSLRGFKKLAVILLRAETATRRSLPDLRVEVGNRSADRTVVLLVVQLFVVSFPARKAQGRAGSCSTGEGADDHMQNHCSHCMPLYAVFASDIFRPSRCGHADIVSI